MPFSPWQHTKTNCESNEHPLNPSIRNNSIKLSRNSWTKLHYKDYTYLPLSFPLEKGLWLISEGKRKGTILLVFLFCFLFFGGGWNLYGGAFLYESLLNSPLPLGFLGSNLLCEEHVAGQNFVSDASLLAGHFVCDLHISIKSW